MSVTYRDARGAAVRVQANWNRPLGETIEEGAGRMRARDLLLRLGGEPLRLSETFALRDGFEARAAMQQATYDEVDVSNLPADVLDSLALVLPESPVLATPPGRSRKRWFSSVVATLITFDRRSGVLRRYRSMNASVVFAPGMGVRNVTADGNPHLQVERSVLADGTWFRFETRETGIYRIDRAYLAGLGVNPDDVDPDHVRLYGNGGRPLPELAGAPRPADLVENPVYVRGGGDGSFDTGDEILFHAHGPTGWTYEPGGQTWLHYVHPFSNTNTYFIRIDAPDGLKIDAPIFTATPGAERLTSHRARYFVERDIENLGQSDDFGSGYDWLGRRLDVDVPRRTAFEHPRPQRVVGDITYRARAVASANPSTEIQFLAGNELLASLQPPAVAGGISTPTGHAARDRIETFTQTVTPSSTFDIDVNLVVNRADSKGWLDWLEVFSPEPFEAVDGLLTFATEPGRTGTLEVVLGGFSRMPLVWDVTEPGAVRGLGVEAAGSGYRVQFAVDDPDQPRSVVAFLPSSGTILQPDEGAPVPNQNLHGEPTYPEFVIVTPSAFRDAAEDLASHRRDAGLSVIVSEIDAIYNEFSGGVPDMRAVRDYFKFLYERTDGLAGVDTLRYALLFGDGHYDFRNLTDDQESPNFPNWIFPFETPITLHRDASYTSDDYFALLDDDEGTWVWPDLPSGTTHELVDLGVGRFTVQTPEEARAVVAKIKHYESPETFGSWRTRYTFVADDGPAGSKNDKDLHTQNADVVAQRVNRAFPTVDLNKIYAISYPVETTVVGRRIPEAKADILSAIHEGTLIWNYSGHGGYNALADERLFQIEDIDGLQNVDRPTIFVTATCSFGAFDKSKVQSGAELLLLKPEGGAVALLTTVRLVYTSTSLTAYNLGLNVELNAHLLDRDPSGLPLRLGEVLYRTKISGVGRQANNRKFNLLGDPTMRVGLPREQIEITSVNGVAPAPGAPVPLRALDLVTIAGQVRGGDGLPATNFDGVLSMSVFDAERTVQIPEDMRRAIPEGFYTLRSDLIYRGDVSVDAGRFRAQFVVPKDISYSNASGRISLYARADHTDAGGATEDVVVGGTSSNPVDDGEGPEIRLFLNDTTFVSGGLTGVDPTLIVKLYDASGINTVGTGVGHELLLVVDGDDRNAVELGDRFEGSLNSFQRGEVRYPLDGLDEGPHTLRVRAWDVVNNSNEAELEFFVDASNELEIRNVFNYPNPMVDATRFVFEHNQPSGTLADVDLRIYTLAGQVIRRMDEFETLPDGVLPGGPVQIPWDGLDADFDPLARGVYLYKLRVEIDDGSGTTQVAEHIGKLAVIR